MSFNIPQRKLGKNGPLVPAFGLGCMGMSNSTYGPADTEESYKVLDLALKDGCTFWDTANVYPGNEEFLSKKVVENREKVFICTKFGFDFNVPAPFINGKKEHVREQAELSLKKLNVSVIDLYYFHRVDENTPIEETIGAMAELVKEGKVKYLGLSECSAATLRKAHAIHPIAAVQVEYSPWHTEIETNGVLATCRELGIAIVAYSPLSRGFLTGQLKSPEDFAADDFRRQTPRFQGENFYKNLELVKQFEALAQKKGVTVSQFVLAWVLAQGDDFIIIPGTKRVKYFEENIGCVNVKLTKEELDTVRTLVDSITAAGNRYPDFLMSNLNK